ncbi:hypothetical protein SUGI_0096310 [Cryptomeria japonica]|nr:hypothetical protein SUGI_0096310 [Cryptomeria japonica]
MKLLFYKYFPAVISKEGSKACNTPGNLSQSQSLQFPYASFEDCSMAALVYCPLVTFITKVSVPFKSHCSNINSSPKYDNYFPLPRPFSSFGT